MKETFERYQLLSKEVQYVAKYIPNWEVFDFENLIKILTEMKELQELNRKLWVEYFFKPNYMLQLSNELDKIK